MKKWWKPISISLAVVAMVAFLSWFDRWYDGVERQRDNEKWAKIGASLPPSPATTKPTKPLPGSEPLDLDKLHREAEAALKDPEQGYFIRTDNNLQAIGRALQDVHKDLAVDKKPLNTEEKASLMDWLQWLHNAIAFEGSSLFIPLMPYTAPPPPVFAAYNDKLTQVRQTMQTQVNELSLYVQAGNTEGAKAYIANLDKTMVTIEQAWQELWDIAEKHHIPTKNHYDWFVFHRR